MKNRKNITKKLFIITFVIFIVFITSNFIIQSLFFQEFYIKWKKDNLKNNLVKFKNQYKNLKDTDNITDLILRFEENNNYKIIIEDSVGNFKYIDKVRNGNIDPLKKRILHEILNNHIYDINLINASKEKNEPIVLIANKKTTPTTRNALGVIYESSKKETIYIVSSLQTVEEASSVMKEFYFYFYIGALFIVLILSLIYSNMITKPLIKITNIAFKMANLNFTEKCEIKSNDEIGNLAASLNSLSFNLNNALTSMKKANEKLEFDIEREKKLSEIRRDFVAAVSHELKTPITLIEGYAEALNDNILEEAEKINSIHIILDETKKMNSLVCDMLDLSQLESGNFKLIKEVFYIDGLINSSVKKFNSIIQEKNITLKLNLIDKIKISGDWNRLDQVITNYLTNALRHTYENGTITINTIDEGNHVKVEVINEGKHIPKEYLDRIWENFYKIDKSRNRSLGGTGIGLSIVKNIIELPKGNYGVENIEEGVSFYFSIKKYESL
ncbi:ATP-binding protein [Haloimpatiens sp. FM7315]|uniref:ATP-binding protein n=1 Tax=Haloimpatiens sp. FM7315 TaxID=3298609 RepID=UPI00370C5630